MVSPNLAELFDIEDLLCPISATNPGGDPLAYSRGLRSQFSELRNPARSANPDDPDRGVDAVDWKAISELAIRTLRETAKDLRVACHLAEASMHRWGLSGLHAGLVLIRRLSEECWDDLAPALDPEDPEVRCAPLENLLDDPAHGPILPTAIRSLPVLPTEPEPISLVAAMAVKDERGSADLASRISRIPAPRAIAVSSDLDAALGELQTLQHVLLDRLGDYAPTFLHLRESLELLRQWFDKVLACQLSEGGLGTRADASSSGVRPPAGDGRVATAAGPSAHAAGQDLSERDLSDAGDPAAHDVADDVEASSGTGQATAASPQTVLEQTARLRSEAYRQLRWAADVLQRMEPHSPIPYLIRRAIRLGDLPLPDLMSALVREESAVELFSRELGLSAADEASPSGDA